MNQLLMQEISDGNLKFRLKPTKTVDKSAPILQVEGETLKKFSTVNATNDQTFISNRPAGPPPPPPPPAPPVSLNDLKLPKNAGTVPKKILNQEKKPTTTKNVPDRDALFDEIKSGNFRLRKTAAGSTGHCLQPKPEPELVSNSSATTDSNEVSIPAVNGQTTQKPILETKIENTTLTIEPKPENKVEPSNLPPISNTKPKNEQVIGKLVKTDMETRKLPKLACKRFEIPVQDTKNQNPIFCNQTSEKSEFKVITAPKVLDESCRVPEIPKPLMEQPEKPADESLNSPKVTKKFEISNTPYSNPFKPSPSINQNDVKKSSSVSICVGTPNPASIPKETTPENGHMKVQVNEKSLPTTSPINDQEKPQNVVPINGHNQYNAKMGQQVSSLKARLANFETPKVVLPATESIIQSVGSNGLIVDKSFCCKPAEKSCNVDGDSKKFTSSFTILEDPKPKKTSLGVQNSQPEEAFDVVDSSTVNFTPKSLSNNPKSMPVFETFSNEKHKPTAGFKNSARFEALRHNFETLPLPKKESKLVEQPDNIFVAKPVFVKLNHHQNNKRVETSTTAAGSGGSSPKRSPSPLSSISSGASSSGSSSLYSTWRVRKDAFMAVSSSSRNQQVSVAS